MMARMSQSPAFARIQRDALRLAAAIPPGRVGTFSALGSALDVPARHIAYIVSRLDTPTRAAHGVHRLVSDTGALQKKIASEQSAMLAAEGIAIDDGMVVNLARVSFDFSKDVARRAKVERTTRPPEHRQGAQGEPALADLPGLGPVSIGWLKAAGITSAQALSKADAFVLYAKIKTQRTRVSVNLLYALIGAQENVDWRMVARERRTEILMRLDDMGLA